MSFAARALRGHAVFLVCVTACGGGGSPAIVDASSGPSDAESDSVTSRADPESTGAASTGSSTSDTSGGGEIDVCAIDPPAVDDAITVWSRALCERAAACECRDYDVATCFLDLRDGFATWWEAAVAAGLTYDGECVAATIAVQIGFACEPGRDSACPAEPCKPFHGELAVDEPCSSVRPGVADDCAQGLRCDVAARCVPVATPLPTVDLGDACFDLELGNLLGICAAGLACDFTDGRCHDAPDAGQPCEQGECAASTWCDPDDDDGPVCKATRPDGDPCQDRHQCTSGECTLGVCLEREGVLCSSI